MTPHEIETRRYCIALLNVVKQNLSEDEYLYYELFNPCPVGNMTTLLKRVPPQNVAERIEYFGKLSVAYNQVVHWLNENYSDKIDRIMGIENNR